mmetsp:Transcript_1239/g.1378  ORF Transcript_1239/g.1378 Transcript_1239/m.1378 type:complete len:229 (-) Transcript_1239:108-794(-)
MADVEIPKIEDKHGDKNYELAFIYRVLSKVLVTRTPQCIHKDNCLVNSLKGFFKNFVLGFGIKLASQILIMLFKRKVDFFKFLQKAKSRDTIGFALFLAGISSIYKLVLCLMRRFNSTHDKLNAAVAGFISSFACLADRNISRRQGIIFYIASRVFENFLKLLDNHKVMEEPKEWGFYLLFIASVFFSYQLYCERDTAVKLILNNMDKFSALKPNETAYVKILHGVGL